ncbi:MAG: ABC transporter permease [Candidatus Lokiarchaeota archaeon]|nr:ABC transporter permease [Candidatus Lokiarchaeota archaeon]
MNFLENKAIQIAIKNIKDKLRHWQYMVFSLGFAVMFTLIFYFFLGRTQFQYGFPGMIIYTTAAGTTSAAISFAVDKTSGMLERLDTMPTGRKNLFLGALLSETFMISLQILIMFILGYAVLQVPYKGIFELIIGFLIAVLFGISSVGIGIIISGIAKTPEIANAIALFYYMPILFLSGSLWPFESAIVFFTPPYWAKQIFLQITVVGDGLLDPLYNSSLIGTTAQTIAIPIWGGLLIVCAFTLAFIAIGVIIFQKKTKF